MCPPSRAEERHFRLILPGAFPMGKRKIKFFFIFFLMRSHHSYKNECAGVRHSMQDWSIDGKCGETRDFRSLRCD